MTETRRQPAGGCQTGGALDARNLRAGDSRLSFAASELKASLAISVPVALIVALLCAGFVVISVLRGPQF